MYERSARHSVLITVCSVAVVIGLIFMLAVVWHPGSGGPDGTPDRKAGQEEPSPAPEEQPNAASAAAASQRLYGALAQYKKSIQHAAANKQPAPARYTPVVSDPNRVGTLKPMVSAATTGAVACLSSAESRPSGVAVAVEVEAGTGCRISPEQLLGLGQAGAENLAVATSKGSRVYYRVGSGSWTQLGPDSLGSASPVMLPFTGAAPVLLASAIPLDVLTATGVCRSCDLRGVDINGFTFDSKADLSGSDLSGANIYNSNFPHANFAGVKFGLYNDAPAQISSTDLTNASLVGAVFDQTLIYDTDFGGADLTKSNFSKVESSGTNFTGVKIDIGGAVEVSDSVLEYPGFTTAPRTKLEDALQHRVDSGDSGDSGEATCQLGTATNKAAGWQNMTLHGVTFVVNNKSRALMTCTTSDHVTFDTVAFAGGTPDLSYTTWTNADLRESRFPRATFLHANLDNVSAVETNFEGAQMLSSRFASATLTGTNFNNASIDNGYFVSANLGQTLNDKRVLEGNFARFDHASISGADFQSANVRGVSFQSSYIFTGAGGSGQGIKPTFQGAKLMSANFSHALISQGDFSEAELTRVNFSNAQCIQCQFGAVDTNDATQANFAGAYLLGSNFATGINLDNSDFTNALLEYTGPQTSWDWGAPEDAGATAASYGTATMGSPVFDKVASCPDSKAPSDMGNGCQGHTMVDVTVTPTPPKCVAAAGHLCGLNVVSTSAGVPRTLTGQGRSKYCDGGGFPAIACFDLPRRIISYTQTVGVVTSNFLYVADTGNNLIRKIDQSGNKITNIAGQPRSANGADIGDGGLATSATLNGPTGMATDAIGQLYVADTGNNRIRKIDTAGNISTIAGTGTAGAGGDGKTAIIAQLNQPTGLTLQCDDTQNCQLYIADTGNNKIRLVNLATGIISTFAGTGVQGDSGDGAGPNLARLNAPESIAIDSSGLVYVADTGNKRIRVIVPAADDPAGDEIIAFGKVKMPKAESSVPNNYDFKNLTDIFFDKQDYFYVTDADRNQLIRLSIAGIKPVAFPGALFNLTAAPSGLAAPSTDAATAQFSSPQGATMTPWQEVVIVDTGNYVVRALTAR